MAADLFAIHRAVRVTSTRHRGDGVSAPRSGPTTGSMRFLGAAITGVVVPVPIPAQMNVAAADVVIGKTMRAKDWAALRSEAQPLIDELEGKTAGPQKRRPPAADPGASCSSSQPAGLTSPRRCHPFPGRCLPQFAVMFT